jgi:DNA transformation protein and related proteins
MSASQGFIAYVVDQLAGLGMPVAVRRMFGGAGIFADGYMFALIADDVLYLKADKENCAIFDAEGLSAFSYEARGRRIELSYRRASERLLDDPDEMRQWANLSLAAARRAADKQPKPQKRKSAKKVAAGKKRS